MEAVEMEMHFPAFLLVTISYNHDCLVSLDVHRCKAFSNSSKAINHG